MRAGRERCLDIKARARLIAAVVYGAGAVLGGGIFWHDAVMTPSATIA
jgi:hypothetical protein